MGPATLSQTFTVYSSLPPELQQRIIELSMQPRIIEVYIATQGIRKKGKVKDFNTYAVKLRSGPVPTLLHINKAVRQEALRKYTAVAAVARLSPLSSLSNQIYVNPEIDTFYIIRKQGVLSYNSSSAIPAFPPFHLMLPNADDVVAFAKKVRHVAIRDPANSFLKNDGPVKNLLFQYQNLTHLEIVFDNRRK